MTDPQGGGFSTELWLSHSGETRTQDELQELIWEEIHADREADRSDVTVEVEDFVATLTGRAPTETSRLAVQHAAERVRGVRSVVNRVAVAT